MSFTQNIEFLKKFCEAFLYVILVCLSLTFLSNKFIMYILWLGRISSQFQYPDIKLSGYRISGLFLMPGVRLSGRISGNLPDIGHFQYPAEYRIFSIRKQPDIRYLTKRVFGPSLVISYYIK